jgi:hypothetical protein
VQGYPQAGAQVSAADVSQIMLRLRRLRMMLQKPRQQGVTRKRAAGF